MPTATKPCPICANDRGAGEPACHECLDEHFTDREANILRGDVDAPDRKEELEQRLERLTEGPKGERTSLDRFA